MLIGGVRNAVQGSFEEAQAKALDRYGSLYVERIESFNSMCNGCTKLGNECDGTTNKIWSDCIYRTVKKEDVV